MSEIEPILGQLDLEFGDLTQEFAFADKKKLMDEELREHGILARAYDRAVEYAGSFGVQLPPLEACEGTVYRQLHSDEYEIGGVQLNVLQVTPVGVSRLAVRVPAYKVIEGSRVAPMGGVFDDELVAEAVARQVDDLVEYAETHSLGLTADLAFPAQNPEIDRDILIIPCTPYDQP